MAPRSQVASARKQWIEAVDRVEVAMRCLCNAIRKKPIHVEMLKMVVRHVENQLNYSYKVADRLTAEVQELLKVGHWFDDWEQSLYDMNRGLIVRADEVISRLMEGQSDTDQMEKEQGVERCTNKNQKETWSLEQIAAGVEEQFKSSQLVRNLFQTSNPGAAGNSGQLGGQGNTKATTDGEPVDKEEEPEGSDV